MSSPDRSEIPGTYIFDGLMAMKAFELNRMCFSFNSEDNRQAYLRDEKRYCDLYHLPDEQRRLLQKRDVLELIRSGANIYYLAKWAGIVGLNVQQIGAQQRGISEEAFKEMLRQWRGD